MSRSITITRELLRDWDACYPDERIAELVPEAGLTPLEILDLDIPVADRLWVVLRPEIIPDRELRLLACLWAERALDALPPAYVDPRSREVVAMARRYADGAATGDELAAWAARGPAAWAAAAASAWAARGPAAWGAAAASAWAAAAVSAAARAAARTRGAAAAWAAAWSRGAPAASEATMADVRRVLEGGAS